MKQESIKEYSVNLRSTSSINKISGSLEDAKFVLLGESTHGTSEFYTWRAKLSKYLIQEKGFRLIAVEGDWPDCYRVNRYVKGYIDSGESAYEVLHAFKRWPTWLWANWEMVAFIEWLREFNTDKPENEKVGFYGLDVYSLWESLDEVLQFLKSTDNEGYELAKDVYRCFMPYGKDADEYAYGVNYFNESCRDESLKLLVNLRSKVNHFGDDYEAAFNAEQNALVIKNAETYYRTMIGPGPLSWNIRDTHMVETLERLQRFHGPKSKAIVWEHNTHIGDARATDMKDAGMKNVGQLLRERSSENEVFIVGFGTYEGKVIAGKDWGEPMEEMDVPKAMRGSWEEIFHTELEGKDVMITNMEKNKFFYNKRGHRAIGVVYEPEFETMGNYVPTILGKRYDAFIHLDRTTALHPLHIKPDSKEIPESYPFGV